MITVHLTVREDDKLDDKRNEILLATSFLYLLEDATGVHREPFKKMVPKYIHVKP